MSLSKIFIRPVDFRATDDSTSPTSLSSVLVSGGLSVVKSTFIGANLTTNGDISITSTDQSTSLSTGSLVSAGGAAFAKNVTIGGNLNMTLQQINNVGPPINPTDAATKFYTDTLVGNPSQTQITLLGTLSSLAVSGSSIFTSTTDSVSTITRAAVFSGGVGIANTLWVGGNGGIK